VTPLRATLIDEALRPRARRLLHRGWLLHWTGYMVVLLRHMWSLNSHVAEVDDQEMLAAVSPQ